MNDSLNSAYWNFVRVAVYFACILSMHHLHMRSHHRPEVGVGPHGAGGTDGYGSLCLSWVSGRAASVSNH